MNYLKRNVYRTNCSEDNEMDGKPAAEIVWILSRQELRCSFHKEGKVSYPNPRYDYDMSV
jgi:hypothetical protein